MINSILVNIGKHFFSNLLKFHFRITHCCRTIAIYRTKVTLTIN